MKEHTQMGLAETMAEANRIADERKARARIADERKARARFLNPLGDYCDRLETQARDAITYGPARASARARARRADRASARYARDCGEWGIAKLARELADLEAGGYYLAARPIRVAYAHKLARLRAR